MLYLRERRGACRGLTDLSLPATKYRDGYGLAAIPLYAQCKVSQSQNQVAFLKSGDSMKYFLAFVVIASCLWLSQPEVHAESDRSFLNKTIKETLEDPTEIIFARYGRRTITLKRLATSQYEMRLALWTLMGEPVHLYECRMPRLRSLIFGADDGYANRVEIVSVGDRNENDISFSGGKVYVSQDVLDKIDYVDFSFSIETYDLFPLPDEFYSKDDERRHIGIFKAYIHLKNPGVLSSPGKWGWDMPGSPEWGKFLSKYEYPLDEGKYELPEDHYMDAKQAKEAFRRMRWHYHKEEDLFVKNWFDIHYMRVNPGSILALIHKHSPEAYAKIMEKE